MTTLLDICDKTIQDMSSEELQERLRNIRRNRRTPVAPPQKVKAKSTMEMTAEEAQALLELLGVTDA